jgi:hypothetical protein
MKPAVKLHVVVLLFAAWFVMSRKVEQDADARPRLPLRREAYVWQTRDSEGLQEAVSRSKGTFETLHFLASEISATAGGYSTKRTRLAKSLLKDRGLVLRVGSSVSVRGFGDSGFRETIDRELRWIAGCEPLEVHLDFDCPQSELRAYGALLHSIQRDFPQLRLVITALPSWLGEVEFKSLAAECAGVVLQLHSLDLPERENRPVVICDPVEARKAVERMETLRCSYRVALSTYGCEVYFDERGKVLDVLSEDSLSKSGSSATRRTVGFSDPVALAILVREWMGERPAFMQGIVWYRLPLDSDRRNWRWHTLERVAIGEVPVSRMEISAEPASSGAWDIVLRNLGDMDELLPETIDPGGEFVAIEGLNGYVSDALERFFLEHVSWPWLAPGDRLVVGWVRPVDEKSRPFPTITEKQ